MATSLQYSQKALFTTYISTNIIKYFIDLITDINQLNIFSTISLIHVIIYVTLVTFKYFYSQ